jgi:hypothetical protein
MRYWWWLLLVAGLLAVGVVAARLDWLRAGPTGATPLPVPPGDEEIAWLHNPTSYESWENFVSGVKRAEMESASGPSGLEVNVSGAYPDRTTAVPEIIINRRGYSGSVRIRWYKVTDEASQEAWVKALAARDRAPIAILGGWSSDRAKELADAMRDAAWKGQKPLLFISQATADEVYRVADNYPIGYVPPQLIKLYDRSFRFCFTNKQIAEAVTDFVFSDPQLRPTPAPGADAQTLAGFAIAWEDDDYSVDLSRQFRREINRRGEQPGEPRIGMILDSVPFSVGRLNRPNARETAVVGQILKQLPPPGSRTVLVLPTVSAPARRTLRALVQGNPAIGKQLVAITGDGIGVNTFFRDRDFAWPVRSLPVPVVLFTHADPFAWDVAGGPAPPRDYAIAPPESGQTRSTTEDIQHFTRMARIVASALFPDGSAEIARDPIAVIHKLRSRMFFDENGDRLSGSGEHVVVLRPTVGAEAVNPGSDIEAMLEVFVREGHELGRKWTRLHAQLLRRPSGGHE